MMDQHTFGLFSVCLSDRQAGHVSTNDPMTDHLPDPVPHLHSKSPRIPFPLVHIAGNDPCI